MYFLLKNLHVFAVIVLAICLVIENMAIKPTISREDVRNLLKVDAVYGLSSLVVLGLGLCLWFWVGKPAEFYSKNPVFHAKIALFVLVGLLSIYPTMFFMRSRKSESENIDTPKAVIRLLRAEIVLLLFIPVLAMLMARGVGL
ncbi:MAG: DUF2214 family protein [Pseudohongiellaceae bacterium]|nr:DUF2214 family protein [Pseudohongiellaceae bacterium]